MSAPAFEREHSKLDEPRLIKRHCGGWLALAPDTERIKIGVTSATEEGAVQKYRETIAEWRKTLAMGGIRTESPSTHQDRT